MNPSTPKHADPLEDLLSTALIEHGNALRSKHAISTRKDWNDHYRASFTRPENWILRAQVRLIHVDGTVHTLVGLYDELVHSYVPACRKLVAASAAREDLPTKMEEVTGPHWLSWERHSFKLQPTERTLALVAALVLAMGQPLRAEAVPVTASLVGGGLQRLTLQEDTLFEGNTPRTILSLPAGLDVLEGLLGGCRVLLWRQISEEAGHAQPPQANT